MPELPEVEHAARCLRAWLRGQVVARAEAENTRIFRGSDRRAFARALAGRRLLRLERRGKHLLLSFDADVGLHCHLGMTGKWVVREPGEPPPRHSRARLYLSGGKVVHYNDPRLFGRIAVCRAAALRELPQIRALGPDPLHDGLEAERLQAALKRTRRAVKVALLDQRVLAGIGNILATEALFRARIHPARPASSLSRRQVGSLVRGLEASLRHTLASMTREGKDAEVLYVQERAGDHPFLVYGRAGEPCSRCREPIARMRLGGRATAFCPRCQRAG